VAGPSEEMTMRLLHRAAAALVLVAVTIMAGLSLAARQSPARQAAADLSRELMSPFCPGKLLADCTSSLAGDLRTEIRTRLEAGASVDAVKAELVREYGAAILGAPPASGVGLLAWWVPVVIALGSAIALGVKVMRAVGAPAAAAPPMLAAADAGVVRLLEDELRDLD